MDFITNQFDYHDAVILNRLIREHARPNMVVFELGVYTGRASLVMLRHIRRMNGRLYSVDWCRVDNGLQPRGAGHYQLYLHEL